MKAASQVETPASDLSLSAHLLTAGYLLLRTDGSFGSVVCAYGAHQGSQ